MAALRGGLFAAQNFPSSPPSAYNKPKDNQGLRKQHVTSPLPEVFMPEIGQTISHYGILEKIGQGGMSMEGYTVFRELENIAS